MSETKLLSVTNDYIFKRTFGYKESCEVTKILLRDVLAEKVNIIELDNQTITEKELMDDKVGIMDIKAVFNGDVHCDVEMQVVNQHNIEKRIMYYWSKMFSRTIVEGNAYNDLKRSICVLIADFELDNIKEVKKYRSRWNIREEEYTSVILTDVFEIVIIELPKYEKYAQKEKRHNLNLWLKFFRDPEVKIMLNKEDDNVVQETKQAIQRAQENLEKLSKDEHERYLAELREKYIRDQKAIQDYGYYKGKDEGRAEGIAEGRAEGISEGLTRGHSEGVKEQSIVIAKRMLEKNFDIEIIIETTGLTKEEIENLYYDSIDNNKADT